MPLFDLGITEGSFSNAVNNLSTFKLKNGCVLAIDLRDCRQGLRKTFESDVHVGSMCKLVFFLNNVRDKLGELKQNVELLKYESLDSASCTQSLVIFSEKDGDGSRTDEQRSIKLYRRAIQEEWFQDGLEQTDVVCSYH